MRHLVPKIEFPEIVIGLVSPIGTPLAETIAELKKNFKQAGYNVHDIHVTNLFHSMKKLVPPEIKITEKPLKERYDSYIAYGNQLRKSSQDPSLIAALSIQNIVETRIINKIKTDSEKFTKNVYIAHQFKRPEEIELLRSVYGKIFFQISVYSRRSSRVDYLSRKFSEDMGSSNPDEYRSYAEALIDADENQVNEKFGQRVGKIFHDADFIVNGDINDLKTSSQIERFFELLFSSNTITPTKIEYGMFAAKSAALRTSDLSRQVGAAVFSDAGEIIAMGSNEVPKAHGGTYWPDEKFDDREFKRKIDSNDKRKSEILKEIFEILEIDSENIDKSTMLKIQNSSAMDALEYGRIIHAEMCAITDASRRGISVKDSTLFSTTFPCHMCAKHIVSAGIKKIYYLEPYPKSLASRLHTDSIKINGQDRGIYNEYPFVEFIHFYGVTPRRYREFFERKKRKDENGILEEYMGGKKSPFLDIKSPFYAQLEDTVLESLQRAIRQLDN
ncbi:anti-phage dCTP deaminase [Hoeflea sp.]|uniref:anti-phage dCTP deaminase n=1 Tax=Hoeflea sp. TaxID=1940281 RepID=UPI003A8EFB4A